MTIKVNKKLVKPGKYNKKPGFEKNLNKFSSKLQI